MFFWFKFGKWDMLPNFDFFSIADQNEKIRILSKRAIVDKTVSYKKIKLFGVEKGKATLIHEDYYVSRCLDVAMFFRESGINIPIYDLTGSEDVEY